MRPILLALLLCLAACSGAAETGPAAPLATPPVATPPSPAPPLPASPPSTSCTTDAECVAIDVCGCSCEAGHAPAREMACSEACPGTPCAEQHAVCRDGQCVLEPLPHATS